MAEIDLEALIAKAEAVQNDKVLLDKNARNEWCIGLHNILGWSIKNGTYADCISQLKRWGVLPKPDYMTIANIPTAHIEWYAKNGGNPEFARLCAEALAPYQQPE